MDITKRNNLNPILKHVILYLPLKVWKLHVY